jgi:hypothetical protein
MSVPEPTPSAGSNHVGGSCQSVRKIIELESHYLRVKRSWHGFDYEHAPIVMTLHTFLPNLVWVDRIGWIIPLGRTADPQYYVEKPAHMSVRAYLCISMRQKSD